MCTDGSDSACKKVSPAACGRAAGRARAGGSVKPWQADSWRAWEAGCPCRRWSYSKAGCAQGVSGSSSSSKETSSKLNSIRHHVLRSRMMFRILSFFPLNGMNGKTNSKGFSVRASELPDAFRWQHWELWGCSPGREQWLGKRSR